MSVLLRIGHVVIFLAVMFGALAQTQRGMASFYGSKFQGRPTASGEIFDVKKLTAAHRTLPFGTMIKVTNLKNGKSIVLKVNDRGPFVDDRIVDLSLAAAKQIDMIDDGVVEVSLEIIPKDLKAPNTEHSFFHIEVNQLRPSGYGVQIMSFSQTDNYVTFVERLQTKYQSAEIVLQSKMVNGQKVIGVIMGQFETRIEAESYRASLDDYPDSYIVDYSKYQ